MLEIVASTRPVEETINEYIKIRPSGVGLEISENLPPEEWVTAFQYFHGLHEHIGFIVGDMLRFAEVTFKEKYTAAVRATGKQIKTLQNYTTTATKVPPDMRVPGLSYSVHAEVASVKPQTQKSILKLAQEKGWNVQQVREEVKRRKAASNPQTPATPAAPVSPSAAAGVTPGVEGATGNSQSPEGVSIPPGDVSTPEQAVATGTETAASGTGSTPASGVPAPDMTKLSPEAGVLNDANIEAADSLTSYIVSKDFDALPASYLTQWADILRPFAAKYEALLQAGHKPRK
jgi:hypothetical protein